MTMTTVSNRAAALNAASALAMYDGATCAADKARAGAAMAEVLRSQLAKAPKKKTGPTDLLTAENLIVTMKRMSMISEARSSIPILACVLAESDGARLTLTATDLDCQYVEVLRAPGLPVFRMAVPIKGLANALRSAKGDITLRDDTIQPKPGETEKGNGHYVDRADGEGRDWVMDDLPKQPDYRLTITAGGLESRLACLAPDDFPVMKQPANDDGALLKPTASATMPAHRFLEPLAFVAPAISAEETRYYLNGVYMHTTVEQGQLGLTFVATDGSRMLVDRGEDSAGFHSAMPGVIIPRKAVTWILRNVRDDEVQVDVWVQKVRVTTATGCFITKLIDGNFPDYQRVIPRDENSTVVGISEPKAWIGALGRLASHTGQKSGSVALSICSERVTGESRNMEGGGAKAELPADEIKGNARELAFNARYLADILGQGDIAVLGISGPNDPALITWPDQPGRKGIIMPLRV